MYGLIAIFDEKTEQVIKDIWKELKEKAISSYAYEVENRRPHITLASYNDINKTEFIKQMDEFYNDKPLKSASIMMVASRLLGTLLAQVLFIPGAKYIAWFTQFIV